jgi:putative outer membrane protein H.8
MERNKPNFAKVKLKIRNYMLPRKYILHFKSSLALIGLAMLFTAFLSATLRFVSTPPTEESSTTEVCEQSAPCADANAVEAFIPSSPPADDE